MFDLATVRNAAADAAERMTLGMEDAAVIGACAEIASSLRSERLEEFSAMARVASTLDLSPFELDLLVLAGLPEEHEVMAYLARRMSPSGEPWLSFGAVARLLGLDGSGRRHLRSALQGGKLHRHLLVRSSPDVPLPERRIRLLPGLWNVMRGVDVWPAGVEPLELEPYPSQSMEAVCSMTTQHRPVLVLVTASHGRSPEEVASFLAGSLDESGIPWLALPGTNLDAEGSRICSAHCVARGVLPLVIGEAAEDLLTNHPGPVAACLNVGSPLGNEQRPLVTMEVGPRDLAEAVSVWESVAPELNGGAERLAGLMRLNHLEAGRAVLDARLRNPGSLVEVADVVAHARKRSDASLPPSVRMVRPTAAWSDLVLPERQLALVRSVFERVAGQVQVLQRWGFDQARANRGVRLLLSGPPGTGKTLTVEVLAAELGLDLMVVDLAALVSKWLGETEKNIGAVFDAAEATQAVLFFDEADAIFGKRTDGGDAHARWANLETAYLLSRMDAFDGLIALATNLRTNIDAAFIRRLDEVIEVANPDFDERCRLWRRHMPSEAPYSETVNVAELARLYPINGGAIRNASISAAFAAAASAEEIDQITLISAIQREYEKAGQSFPGMPVHVSSRQEAMQ